MKIQVKEGTLTVWLDDKDDDADENNDADHDDDDDDDYEDDVDDNEYIYIYILTWFWPSYMVADTSNLQIDDHFWDLSAGILLGADKDEHAFKKRFGAGQGPTGSSHR